MRYDKKENTILLHFKGLSNSPIFQHLNFSFHRHFKGGKQKFGFIKRVDKG